MKQTDKSKRSPTDKIFLEKFKKLCPTQEDAYEIAMTTLGMSAQLSMFIMKNIEVFGLLDIKVPLEVHYALGSTAVHMMSITSGKEFNFENINKSYLCGYDEIQDKVDIVTDALIALRKEKNKR